MEKKEDTNTLNNNTNKINVQDTNENKDINKEFNTSTIPISADIDKKKRLELPITFGNINRNNYNQLKQLNNMTLPVRYQSGFYLRINYNLRFGKFAYFNDIIVGAISWKYDICEGVKSIYLMTISVLDEYRRYGIASKLLEEMIKIHKNVKQIDYINLHVQTSNEVALKFYVKNNFEKVKLIEDYYTGTEINPKDAWYLKYNLHQNKYDENKGDSSN